MSTFDGLYIAKSGVQASQTGLNLTGHNISNAGTKGYTRQRIDQYAIPPRQEGGRYAVSGATYGQGVRAQDTTQIRDLFLDGEYRTQNAQYGESNLMNDVLSGMEDIFSTTTTSSSSSDYSVVDILSSQFSDLISQMESLVSGEDNASESAIYDSSKILATKLNRAAKDLETTRTHQSDNLTSNVKSVNDLMRDIASLNEQIEDAASNGSSALELKDQRNLKLDELSQYVSIKVEPAATEGGVTVYLANADGTAITNGTDKYTLIDDGNAAKFTVTQDNKGEDGKVFNNSFEFTHIRLTEALKTGSVSFPLTMGSEDSVYRFETADGSADVTLPKGTKYSNLSDLQTEIQNQINTQISDPSLTNHTITISSTNGELTFQGNVVNGVANPVSVAHKSGANDLNIGLTTMKNADLKSGSFSGYLQILNESGEYDSPATSRGIGFYAQYLDAVAEKFASVMNWANSTNVEGSGYPNSPLFTSDGSATITAGSAAITAKNIQVSNGWSLTDSKNSAKEGDYSNITAMITALASTKVDLNASGNKLFHGTIQAAFSNETTMLGQDTASVISSNVTSSNRLNTIDSERQSESSVDINDETINMIQYNKALTASSRFMTAVDECLQTIINNMGLAGRG